MTNEEYFRKASKEFDIEADIRLSAWAAQWFVEKGILTMEEALTEFRLTKEFLKWYCCENEG